MSTSRIKNTSDEALLRQAQRVGRALAARGWRVVTAESCTAGWVTKVLTDVEGSSAWVDGGYVVYSNAAKMRVLQVPRVTLRRHGAVSAPTARAMARGALRAGEADIAIAVSGIAGPTGGTALKPAGTVWFAVATPKSKSAKATLRLFKGNREAVRRQAVTVALQLLGDAAAL